MSHKSTTAADPRAAGGTLSVIRACDGSDDGHVDVTQVAAQVSLRPTVQGF
jgi:hypothetical protein